MFEALEYAPVRDLLRIRRPCPNRHIGRRRLAAAVGAKGEVQALRRVADGFKVELRAPYGPQQVPRRTGNQDGATRGQGNKETRKRGNKGHAGQGNRETGRQGNQRENTGGGKPRVRIPRCEVKALLPRPKVGRPL